MVKYLAEESGAAVKDSEAQGGESQLLFEDSEALKIFHA